MNSLPGDVLSIIYRYMYDDMQIDLKSNICLIKVFMDRYHLRSVKGYWRCKVCNRWRVYFSDDSFFAGGVFQCVPRPSSIKCYCLSYIQDDIWNEYSLKQVEF